MNHHVPIIPLGPCRNGSDTDKVSKLLETLAEELERPREITPQVVAHIGGTYEIEREGIGDFLDARLTGLEDYEHDLILSPLFTPKLADQALFAELLGKNSVPKGEWPALIQQLAARPTRAQLITSDKKRHTVTLREVTLERYVHRLRLEGSIPEAVLNLLGQPSFAPELPQLKAIVRRAIWENTGRLEILTRYLTSAERRGLYQPGDGLQLLRVAEDYKPADVANLVERIPAWQEALRIEIETAGHPKPFFSGSVQADHGGERDQRQLDGIRLSAKKDEFAFLDRLHQALIS
jgi:hypothetical protein